MDVTNTMRDFKTSPTKENFQKILEMTPPARVASKAKFYKSLSRPLKEWEKAWVGFADEVNLPKAPTHRTIVMASRDGGFCPTWC